MRHQQATRSHSRVWLTVFILSLPASFATQAQDARPGPDSVEGVDLTGEYRFENVRCEETDGGLVSVATLPELFDQVTIFGNSYSEITQTEECVVNTSGRIVFRPDGSFTLENMSTVVFPAGVRLAIPACSSTVDMRVTTDEGTQTVPLELNFQENEAGTFSGTYSRDPGTGTLNLTDLLPGVSVAGQTCSASFVLN